MPSLATRLQIQRLTVANAEAAAAAANAAAEAANNAIGQIEDGTLELDAVTIGGVRFVNNGGVLGPEEP